LKPEKLTGIRWKTQEAAMKNFPLILPLLFVAALILPLLFVAAPSFGQAGIPHWPTQNGYPVNANFGYKYIATPTLNINADEVFDLNACLPVNTIGFELRAASGSFLIGHGSNLATGSSRIGRRVAEGQSIQWSGLAGDWNGGIVGEATATIVIIDGVWGFYEKD
jgi:hypothetical protein